MITLQKIGDAIKFTFSGNTHYLQDGTVEVPVNSLSLTIDDSGMATFRKSASNDIFISATYGELGMTKEELVAWYKENMVDGGGSDITSGDVQNMIDESISGKADSSAVTEEISAAVSGKQDTLIAGENITISGNVISSEGGNNVVELTQAEYDALVSGGTVDPTAFYIITDAVAFDPSTKVDTSAITTSITSESTDTQVPSAKAVYDKFDEVEQVTAVALNALNDKFGGLSLVKLTQSEYNALSPNYDNNTLYVIVN